ncbi:hypothetical protein [Sphingomonas astaxanthinifaciens]|uniref:Uncharacterized protein n=1 Tax=Sphingomonas astaxanthinifaciens DSM 22298 TaxID=1123267 RepID=A0ABQ5Z392_9SPHN|nr:hypothetical protein [Sphingomonas astaxanthinifaciens]GLR47198.1 hypothetical protein GCM10007925_09090 [Sphingomonas astaxanthinifaciens DSM 22298]
MVKSAVAYRANGKVVIAPVIRTTSGIGLEVDPKSLGAAPDQESIAGTLAEALARSDRVVPQPSRDEWKGLFQPFLTATGVRSHKAFMDGAQRVSIRVLDHQLKLTPGRNLGSKEGFEPIPDQAQLHSADDLHSAAAALLRMLSPSAA